LEYIYTKIIINNYLHGVEGGRVRVSSSSRVLWNNGERATRLSLGDVSNGVVVLGSSWDGEGDGGSTTRNSG